MRCSLYVKWVSLAPADKNIFIRDNALGGVHNQELLLVHSHTAQKDFLITHALLHLWLVGLVDRVLYA